MKPAPRFWPLAALILLPVLAAVAVYGLKQRWTAMREEAAALCRARTCAREWIAALQAAGDASPPVFLYDEVPRPRAAVPKDVELEAMMNSGDERDLDMLMRTGVGAGLTTSGLPVRAVAAWRWFEMQSRRAEETGSIKPTAH